MGKKIFVTYKYGDRDVLYLNGNRDTTARNYVDELQDLLDEEDHINKGENDGEDLSDFKDSTIASKLRNKIFDSSITIVIISKGMKESFNYESDQWIPWEVSYSLKEHSRDGRTSYSNAVLAVVLPDCFGNYDYYLVEDYCKYCNCTLYKTDTLFHILRKNMFNQKELTPSSCDNHSSGLKIYKGNYSYIHSVKWSDFINDINKYLDIALERNANINDYDIYKHVD